MKEFCPSAQPTEQGVLTTREGVSQPLQGRISGINSSLCSPWRAKPDRRVSAESWAWSEPAPGNPLVFTAMTCRLPSELGPLRSTSRPPTARIAGAEIASVQSFGASWYQGSARPQLSFRSCAQWSSGGGGRGEGRRSTRTEKAGHAN